MFRLLLLRSLLIVSFMGAAVPRIFAMKGRLGIAFKADSIIINQTNKSKLHTVKIYTNNSNTVLFFTGSGKEGTSYKMLLFREKGSLIEVASVRNRETAVVSKPGKGNYYFEIFNNDDQIETGNIIVY